MVAALHLACPLVGDIHFDGQTGQRTPSQTHAARLKSCAPTANDSRRSMELRGDLGGGHSDRLPEPSPDDSDKSTASEVICAETHMVIAE